MGHRAVVYSKQVARVAEAAILLIFLLPAPVFAHGQLDPFNDPGNTIPRYTSHGGAPLLLKVFAENSKVRLDRQSVVKLYNQITQTVSWQTTSDIAEASFGDVPFGHYDLEVSAVGYLTGHKEFQVVGSLAPIQMEIVLQKDPAAVNLNIADGALPPKARKDTKHGVSALKSGNLNEADKRLNAAYKLAPANADLNFLLGYLFYQKKDFGRAQVFLDAATNLNPNNVQALTLMGRVGLQQENYGSAATMLERAVAADSDYWVAHDLLANAYLRQAKYQKASEEARLSLEKGKGTSGSAQLVLGQALVNLGKRQEGIQELNNFLQRSPKSPAVPQVRNLIAEINARETAIAVDAEAAKSAPRLAPVDTMIAAPEPTFSVKPWQPPGVDDAKPSVAAGVTCPYENVIEMSGARVKQLVDDVSRIAAIEHLLHEQVDEMGNATTRDTRDFNYVVAVSEQGTGRVGVEEYRAEHLGLADFPDQISSSGFAALAFVFHPAMREDFETTCEGLGDWHGQAAWLVHFKQREDRPARLHDYRVGGDLYSLKVKGRAWVTADKFQIVRIESELVSPIPKIQLRSEHQIVEYGPVPFPKKNVELWLPKSAEIYFDFRKHRYYRRHSFDHYMLFSTDTQEKRNEPKAPSHDTQPN